MEITKRKWSATKRKYPMSPIIIWWYKNINTNQPIDTWASIKNHSIYWKTMLVSTLLGMVYIATPLSGGIYFFIPLFLFISSGLVALPIKAYVLKQRADYLNISLEEYMEYELMFYEKKDNKK